MGGNFRRRSAAWFLLPSAFLGLSTAGCEAIYDSRPSDAPQWAKRPGGALSIELRRALTIPSRQSGELYERGQPEIDVAHRRVFVGTSDHGMYAIKADSGETLWRFETLGAVQCEPLYDEKEDTLYFGSNDGALYKVRAFDGELIWRFNTNAEVARRPVMRGGTIYVVNANDTLVAIDAATGKLRWHQHRTPAFGMEVAGYAGPTLGRDKVYAAFSDGTVQAYSLEDGSEQWPTVDLAAEAEQASGGSTARYLDVDTTPVLNQIASGPVVHVASYVGGVYALDAENGARAWVNEKATGVTNLVLWQEPARAPKDGTERVAARKILYASSGLSGLWALDPENGHTIWHRNLPEGGITAPVPVEGALIVGTTRYGIFLFSPLDGGVIDGLATGNGFAAAPAAYGRRAFALSNGGSFLGLVVQPPG